MKTLLDHVVFDVGGTNYTWEDVLVAAKAWGDWAELEQQVRQGIACVKKLEQVDEDLDDEEVESAAREFRYARDLVAASDAEAWFEKWGLTAETWMEYIERFVLRKKWSAELPEIVSEYAVTEEEVEENVWADGVCAGHFERFVQKLAARVAVHEKLQEETPHPQPLSPQAGRGESLLPSLDASFQLFTKQVLTSKAIRDQITAHYAGWIRIDCRCVSFPDEQMAREAALCVQQDGEPLDDVAGRAGTEVQQERFYLEHTDPALRPHFQGAKQGELLGPLAWNGQQSLFLILDKIMPSIDDPEICQRAEQAVIRSAIAHEVNSRVHWKFF